MKTLGEHIRTHYSGTHYSKLPAKLYDYHVHAPLSLDDSACITVDIWLTKDAKETLQIELGKVLWV
jgi:hypothetical protein